MHSLNGQSQDAFRGSDATDDATSWDFISPDARGSSARIEDPELERYLVEEIARAQRRSPLMGRLAHVEHELGKPPPGDRLGSTAAQQEPPLPLPSALASVRPREADLPMPTDGPKIDQPMDAFGGDMPRFVSAEGHGNAPRAKRLIRLRTVLSWIAALAIGAAIAAIALPLQG